MASNLSPMSVTVILVFLFFLFPIKSYANGENPTPFEFIKDLEGCRKGHKVKGIHKLKNYLQQLGYLSYGQHSKHQPEAESADDHDDFDDLLEFAIKTFQTNFNLETSGNLDSETVLAMVKPRCGVADIINGRSRMRSGSSSRSTSTYPHGSALHTVAHYSFFSGTPRWPTTQTNLTITFLPSTPVTAARAIRRAFGQWSSVTQFRFAEIDQGNSSNGTVVADLTISFHRGDHGDGAPFDGPGGTMAHSFAPTDGRLHFDADETWVVGADATAYDLETVALHEIGHLLGLGHSSIRDAIMYPTISVGETKGLHEDDIQGIQDLYNSRITRPSSCTLEIL